MDRTDKHSMLNNQQRYTAWDELIKMASQYDWAVEGFPAPADAPDRATAVELRNRLIKLAGEYSR